MMKTCAYVEDQEGAASTNAGVTHINAILERCTVSTDRRDPVLESHRTPQIYKRGACDDEHVRVV